MGALIFAALVIIGAVSLVGTEDESGTLVETGDDLARQKATMDADIARESTVLEVEEPQIYEDSLDGWDDEELIDDTTGESTEPMVDTETQSAMDAGEVADEVILVTEG